MTRDLSRLLNPASVAVVGGGAWCAAVIAQLQRMGFGGAIWPIHPARPEVAGLPAFTGIPDLPGAPDATFIGINRDATIGAVERLARAGGGGAVCFASGFAEVEDGADLHARLIAAAGEMPILGPNCYGFVNALDGAALWPDQHGMRPVDRGVAILTQSSNIAINLTMARTGPPIALLVTCGNQAQMSQAAIARALLDDPRVTAIGCHVEGFGDPRDWQALARAAAARDVPLVVLKTGRSEAARTAAISHTASLAGADAGAQALMDRLGIARAADPESFLATLALLHGCGRLPSRRIASMSCSGGEAALVADLAEAAGLATPALNDRQRADLSAALGPRVALANPLDYHTYIWRDTEAMAATFRAMSDPSLALNILIADYPRDDICDPADWECVTAGLEAAAADTACPLALVSSLPDTLPETAADRLRAAGVVPLAGLQAALSAIAAAATPCPPEAGDIWPAPPPADGDLLDEPAAKALLARHGVPVPRAVTTDRPDAADLPFPVALKALGFAHKTEAGAVALNLADPAAVAEAAAAMPGKTFLVEEMITGAVAELLIGVQADPAHGFVLTLGAGGQLTEIWDDVTHLLLPAPRETVAAALDRLRIAPLLAGFRGRPGADRDAILDAISAVQDCVAALAPRLQELEINPLVCTPDRAVAVDALIRITP